MGLYPLPSYTPGAVSGVVSSGTYAPASATGLVGGDSYAPGPITGVIGGGYYLVDYTPTLDGAVLTLDGRPMAYTPST